VDRLKQHANKLFKTKEMILGPLAKLSPQPLSCNSGSPPSTVEMVQYFKLLGISPSPLTATGKNTLTQ